VSCSLTYDDVLSRVRITADGLCATGDPTIVDTFSRTTVTGTWTTADTGQAWTITGGVSSDYQVTGGVGRQNNTTVNSFRGTYLNAGTPDIDYAVTVSVDKIATGANQIIEVNHRFQDTANYYAARLTFLTDQSVTVDVRKRVANVSTTLATTTVAVAGTHEVNQQWRVRLSVRGSTIKAKAWRVVVGEPDWQVSASDFSLTTGNNLALRSVLSTSTSNAPVLFSFDNLETFGSSYAVVDRTTNDVTYTTVRGATAVPITTGCELARTVDDYEFPVGDEITYRVRAYNADGSVAVTTLCTITINLDVVWIKSIGRPFLNQRVNCVLNPSPITRPARNGVFDVIGRSFPIAVTDVRGSRRVTVRVVTQTTQERNDMDLLLASGDPVFYHTPADYPLPTMYAVIDDTTESRPVLNRRCSNDWRLYELPSIEVAAPTADVVGATSTWQTVVTTYATWADVLAAHDTWADLLELVGDGSEVIVP
jgi:hypothetical protein